jgi:hypothetical protein
VRAQKDDAAAAPVNTSEEEQHQVAKAAPSSTKAVAPRAAYPAVHLPSVFHEMQREMDAMSRVFGMPSMFDRDPFFSRAPAMLSKLELPALPTMRVAVDVEEDDKAYTIKADVPGM